MKAGWVLRTARRQIQLHRLLVAAAAASFFLLAVFAGGSRLGVRTVGRWGGFVGQNVHLIVYLGERMNEEDAVDLAAILRRIPNVAQVIPVDPVQALENFKTSALAFGADTKTLETLEPAYFPRSLEVHLVPSADLSASATDLAKRVRSVPGVVQVDAMSSGLARLSVWSHFGKRLGMLVLGAFGLLSLASVVAVFVRVRGALARRTAVLVQLGETSSGVRLPSTVWMAVTAALGGGAAAGVLALGWQPLLGRLEHSLGMAAAAPLPVLGRGEIAAGLATLVAVGLALGYLATPATKDDGHA